MKLKFIVVLIFVYVVTGVKAQSVDESMRALVERADWFELEEVYPQKRAEMQSEMLKRLADVMLHTHFNRPQMGINSLDTFLTYHQNELESKEVYDLIALKSRLFAEQGLYQDASNNCAHFLNQLAKFKISRDSFPTHDFIEKHYEEISYIPKPEVIRPDRDIDIPLKIKKTDSGELMYIPVTVHGKEYHFMFDTGVDFIYLSDRMAKEMDIHISYESDQIKKISNGAGKIGAIDSMQIGDLKIKHMLVMVGAPTEEDAFQVDAVLGLDFFRLVGETQFFPKSGKVIFPVNQTMLPKSGRNLMINNNKLFIKVYSGKERLVLRLNTGDSYSGLYYPYFVEHKEFIESKGGMKKPVTMDNFGTTKEITIYRLPQLSLRVGKKKARLKNVPVSTEMVKDLQQNEDGELGMDFIKQFKKVVINCDEMFVEVK